MEALELFFVAQFAFNSGRIGDVVSVLTARSTLQQGGRVDIRDSKPRQVFQNLGCFLEKFCNITLKRGYTSDLSLWKWFRSFEQGVLQRTTMSITLLDEQHNPVLVWRVLRAWPCKYSGPLLNAKTSDVAIETLEICHEGIELAGP